jgi:hypothetical protein
MRAVGVTALAGPLAAVSLIGLAAAASWRPRRAALLGSAIGLCLLPVVWVGLAPGSSGGGRVLYLAGVPVAWLAAAGVHTLLEARREVAAWAAIVATAIVLGTAVASLEAQRGIWAQASRLSRAGVDAFRPFVGTSEPVHVANLPFWFAEGPYVLKSYAFGYYYHPARLPPVSATALSLTSVGGRVTVTTRQPEPGAPPAPPGARVVTLPIDLP